MSDKNENDVISVEKRVCQTLWSKIKERKIKPLELAKALQPPLSESQLRHLLSGGSALSIDRFFQLAKLIQIEPLEILHAANPDPKFEQPFTPDQENFLVENIWHYKIMKALAIPRTEEELSSLFPECSDISKILKLLVDKKIILEHVSEKKIFYRVNANPFQITTIEFGEGYTKLLLKMVKEMHETTVECSRHRLDLIKYIRNVFVADYLTPEQMIALRERLIAVFSEFRRSVGRNRLDPEYGTIAKQNLVGFITLLAPLNRTTFLKRNKE